ncbi:hypothetical protein SFC07_09810 [Corynebacterium callunae]|uniref:Rv1157c family protein n=1 Tax=Corynebacterium callunae TaxID=1721 RepID=UPI00398252A5
MFKRITAVALATTIAFATPAAHAISPVEQAFNYTSNLSSGLPLDQWGRPNEQVRQQVLQAVNQPWVPQDVKNTVTQALGLISETPAESEISIPENAPRIAQFFWPTRAENCINGNSASVGSVFAVPGPAALPLPGAGVGQSSFVFTALGTGALARDQHSTMQVQWANLSTLRYGTTTLGNTGINPEGPSTISGVADTGTGIIVAIMSGGLSTTTEGGQAECNFAPTAVVFDVR